MERFPAGTALVLVGMILVGIAVRDEPPLLLAAALVAGVAAGVLLRHKRARHRHHPDPDARTRRAAADDAVGGPRA